MRHATGTPVTDLLVRCGHNSAAFELSSRTTRSVGRHRRDGSLSMRGSL